MTTAPSAEAPSLAARLFGQVAVEVDGVAVDGALVGKARSLLQYLLIAGRPIHREVLMEVFWPGFDACRARNNLNVTMTALRRALGPGGRALIVLRGGCYGVAPSASVSTDVADFSEALQRARWLDGDGQVEPAVRAYEAAVEHYRGELVAEDPYSEWLEGPREYHRAAQLDALKRIARLALALDRPADAAHACRAALLVDSLDEDAVELLMTAYLAQDQAWQVSKTFADYRRRLERRLRARPSPRLDRLVERALS